MRRILLLIAIASTGCSIDAGGTAENGTLVEDTGSIAVNDSAIAIDSTLEDTSVTVDDTAPSDTSMPDTGALVDSGAPDTTMPDTTMPDTTMPDTAMPDTAMPDTAMPDTKGDATTCTESGAIVYAGHCYFQLSTARNWWGSRDTCVARGAHLVTIGSGAEQNEVQKVGSGERWIGLAKSSSGGSFDWFNGDSGSYRNWDTDEPNGSGSCARMMPDGKWRDDSCDSLHVAICERDSI